MSRAARREGQTHGLTHRAGPGRVARRLDIAPKFLFPHGPAKLAITLGYNSIVLENLRRVSRQVQRLHDPGGQSRHVRSAGAMTFAPLFTHFATAWNLSLLSYQPKAPSYPPQTPTPTKNTRTMSFAIRRTLFPASTLVRSFASTPVSAKTVTETVKDAAEKVCCRWDNL